MPDLNVILLDWQTLAIINLKVEKQCPVYRIDATPDMETVRLRLGFEKGLTRV